MIKFLVNNQFTKTRTKAYNGKLTMFKDALKKLPVTNKRYPEFSRNLNEMFSFILKLTPEEVRYNSNIRFKGELGYDAGGVKREFYS